MTKLQRVSHFINQLSLLQLWLLAFAPRLLWWLSVVLFGDASFTMYDSAQFELLADNMLEFGEFSRSTEAPFFPDIARTPGYPVFLLPFYAAGASGAIIALFQSMLAAAVPVIIFKTAERLNLSSPYVAFIILSLDLSLILFMPLILSDGLFVFLLSLLLYSVVKNKNTSLFINGLLLGLLILVRPIALFLPLLFLVFYLVQRTPIKSIFLFFLGCILLPGGWMIRNYHHFNKATLSSMSSNNLLLYNAANIYAKEQGISFASAQRSLAQEALHSVDWDTDELASKKYISNCTDRALEIIKESPVILLKQVSHSMALYFFKPPRSYYDKVFQLDYNYDPLDGLGESTSLLNRLNGVLSKSSVLSLIFAVLSLLFNIWVMFLAIRGGIFLVKKHPQLAVLLIGGALYFCVFSVFTTTDARFRLPAVPFIALLAAVVSSRKASKNYHH